MQLRDWCKCTIFRGIVILETYPCTMGHLRYTRITAAIFVHCVIACPVVSRPNTKAIQMELVGVHAHLALAETNVGA